jgi:hypothetical protein
MAATIIPQFEGQPILEIDTNGTLNVKFKEVGVKNKVNYELTGRVVATYINNTSSSSSSFSRAKVQDVAPKNVECAINSTLSTSSSTGQVVNATIFSKLPPLKPAAPRILAYVKYDGLLLKDLTNDVEFKLGFIEQRYHAIAAPSAHASAPTAIQLPTPAPAPATATAIVSSVAPQLNVIDRKNPRFAGAAAPSVVIPALAPAPAPAKAGAAPTMDNGILTIDIDNSAGIKQIILNLQ